MDKENFYLSDYKDVVSIKKIKHGKDRIDAYDINVSWYGFDELDSNNHVVAKYPSPEYMALDEMVEQLLEASAEVERLKHENTDEIAFYKEEYEELKKEKNKTSELLTKIEKAFKGVI